VTGERQSYAGDNKKGVAIPVAKPSPKDLGRSMLRWKRAQWGGLLAQFLILAQATNAKSAHATSTLIDVEFVRYISVLHNARCKASEF
jgi:hypothetical protein